MDASGRRWSGWKRRYEPLSQELHAVKTVHSQSVRTNRLFHVLQGNTLLQIPSASHAQMCLKRPVPKGCQSQGSFCRDPKACSLKIFHDSANQPSPLSILEHIPKPVPFFKTTCLLILKSIRIQCWIHALKKRPLKQPPQDTPSVNSVSCPSALLLRVYLYPYLPLHSAHTQIFEFGVNAYRIPSPAGLSNYISCTSFPAIKFFRYHHWTAFHDIHLS